MLAFGAVATDLERLRGFRTVGARCRAPDGRPRADVPRLAGTVAFPLPPRHGVVVRLRRRRGPQPMSPDLVVVEDNAPRDSIFEQPLDASVTHHGVEAVDDDRLRVTFRVIVRDAGGRRCPELAVNATIQGPDRTASGEALTDLMGAVRFRMVGPAGTYRFQLDEVAAKALTWTSDDSVVQVEVSAGDASAGA
jgi:hypothetical protein